MRLIDADELIYMTLGEDTEKPFRFVPTEFIEDAPTIDAVPVIRCKECKHCNREIALGEWEGSCRYWNTHSVMLNDFCSRAKRKEE